jgi:1-acyl-sn-glycerol-3-phosphate acyltransferase
VVLIVYPHTSNWDFFIGYLARRAMGMPAIWIGKHTIFRWPVDGLLRSMGGIPVDRAHAAGVIPALLREFARRETVCLALAPEGTRSHRDHIKRGFYRIALAARVPVGLGFIDFATHTVGVDRWIDLTGDEDADLEQLRRAYAGRVGRHPEKASELRFKPERGADGEGGPADG